MVGVADIDAVRFAIHLVADCARHNEPEGLCTRNEAVAGDIWAQASAMVGLGVGPPKLAELEACGAGAARTPCERKVVAPIETRRRIITTVVQRATAMVSGD
jgi:hypothetical protein